MSDKPITFIVMELVILDEIIESGGCNWKQIKEAVLAQGFEPVDWLTQVRGPLQSLIDEGKVVRDSATEIYRVAKE